MPEGVAGSPLTNMSGLVLNSHKCEAMDLKSKQKLIFYFNQTVE